MYYAISMMARLSYFCLFLQFSFAHKHISIVAVIAAPLATENRHTKRHIRMRVVVVLVPFRHVRSRISVRLPDKGFTLVFTGQPDAVVVQTCMRDPT